MKSQVSALLVLAVWLAGPGLAQQPAAVVNGEVITIEQVEEVLAQRLADGHTPPEQVRILREEVLTMLIDDVLLRQYLGKFGPRISNDDIEHWIGQLKSNLDKQGRTLDDYYHDLGSNPGELRKSIAHMLQWVRFVNEQLNEQTLRSYYEENRDFFDQVTVRASHLVIRVPAGATELREEARRNLEDIRRDILAGKLSFADAAEKYSQCPSAAKGGDIGYFPRKFAVDETLARAAFALKPGDISNIVATEHGLHLIQVTDRKEGMKTDFSQIKETVREVAAGEMMQRLLSGERQSAKIEVMLSQAPIQNAGYETMPTIVPAAPVARPPVQEAPARVPPATPPAAFPLEGETSSMPVIAPAVPVAVEPLPNIQPAHQELPAVPTVPAAEPVPGVMPAHQEIPATPTPQPSVAPRAVPPVVEPAVGNEPAPGSVPPVQEDKPTAPTALPPVQELPGAPAPASIPPVDATPLPPIDAPFGPAPPAVPTPAEPSDMPIDPQHMTPGRIIGGIE